MLVLPRNSQTVGRARAGADAPAQDHAAALLRRIEAHRAVVGVLGLGYVGLPLTLAFSRSKFPVLGFDIDPGKVERLHAGESYLRHIPGAAVAEASSAASRPPINSSGSPRSTSPSSACRPR
jgi:hypothetical protein